MRNWILHIAMQQNWNIEVKTPMMSYGTSYSQLRLYDIKNVDGVKWTNQITFYKRNYMHVSYVYMKWNTSVILTHINKVSYKETL